jgi:D-amino-acid dehydrogenase
MLFTSEKAGEEERKVAAMAKNENLEVKELSLSELKELEPTISNAVKGALHYECDAHTTPNEIMHKLIAYLASKGVIISKGEKVVDVKKEGNNVTQVITNKTTHKTDEVVVASGSWSHLLAKKLGFNLLLEAGKGYRINVERPTGINLPAVLMEAKVAVTPMNGFTRFAGTMELSGINHTIRKERVQAIARASEQYYTNLTINIDEIEAAQCGLRPVSPDGLPYIGRPTNFNNVTFATGHAMMGWSLGPATGKLVAEIIDNKRTAMEIAAFHPNRKF